MVAAAQTHDVLTVVDDQFGNPSSALDLADGILTVIDHWRQGRRIGLGDTHHLVGSGSTSWCGFARAILDECRAHGLPAAEVRPIRTDEWPTKAFRPRNSTLDCAKFAVDFGFTMPEWPRSLATVVERLARRT
jgi:dTDP-4-dehydrorhamnose reductase